MSAILRTPPLHTDHPCDDARRGASCHATETPAGELGGGLAQAVSRACQMASPLADAWVRAAMLSQMESGVKTPCRSQGRVYASVATAHHRQRGPGTVDV